MIGLQVFHFHEIWPVNTGSDFDNVFQNLYLHQLVLAVTEMEAKTPLANDWTEAFLT